MRISYGRRAPAAVRRSAQSSGANVKTVLDEGRGWFLESASYTDYSLRLILSEQFITNTWPNRRVAIDFLDVVASQMVNESFSVPDPSEEGSDGGYLRALDESFYFAHVKARHGLFQDVWGEAKHFRVWTETKVVDVIACCEPTVELLASDAA